MKVMSSSLHYEIGFLVSNAGWFCSLTRNSDGNAKKTGFAKRLVSKTSTRLLWWANNLPRNPCRFPPPWQQSLHHATPLPTRLIIGTRRAASLARSSKLRRCCISWCGNSLRRQGIDSNACKARKKIGKESHGLV